MNSVFHSSAERAAGTRFSSREASPATDPPSSKARTVASTGYPNSRASTIHSQVPPTPRQMGHNRTASSALASHTAPVMATTEAMGRRIGVMTVTPQR
jgi:hypothetical protein